jgi:glycosyltransferase involved in cell wall biosynthesis
MDRAHAAVAYTDETVVHVIGRLTESEFAFVGSTSHALGETGVSQTVILIQEPPDRSLLAKFHPAVRLELPQRGAGPWARFRAAVQTLCRAAGDRPVAAIHLHGMLPSMTAVYAAWFCGLSPKLFMLPHGTRLQGLLRAACAVVRRPRATAPAQALAAPDTPQPIRLVEHPVDARFFTWERQESRRPLVVSGCAFTEPFGPAQFAQQAVLLGEESMAVSFNWVGRVDAESRARLKAANVGIFDEEDPAGRAAKLAGAWLFVGYGNTSLFPLRLAEAMSLGLPCVAWDSPQTRSVLRHGETGLLCSTPSQMLACIAQLIDSPELRHNMGRAAQEEALRRFHPTKLRELIHETTAATVTPA